VNSIESGQPGFDSWQGQRLSLLHCVQTGSETHPAYYSMGIGVVSLGIKRPGREADHSPPSGAEIKKPSRYTSTPPRKYS